MRKRRKGRSRRLRGGERGLNREGRKRTIKEINNRKSRRGQQEEMVEI
jgi:hypothetical protein